MGERGERYLEVAIDAPTDHARTYTYTAPPSLDLRPGQLVWIPIGGRLGQGVVFDPAPAPPGEPIKTITGTVAPDPLLFPWQLDLARWIAEQYVCSLFAAAALMLPPGVERRVRQFVRLVREPDPDVQLTAHQLAILALLRNRDRLAIDEAKRALKKGSATVVVEQLVRKRLVERFDVVDPPKVQPKRVRYLRLGAPWEDLERRLGEQRGRRNLEVLRLALKRLRDEGPLTPAELVRRAEVSSGTVQALRKAGLVETFELDVRRDPLAHRTPAPSPVLDLTSAQSEALAAISVSLDQGAAPGEGLLLHGVTGSGKTEVYLQAIRQAIDRGGGAIVLVPEIALTAQTVDRIAARFPGRVAVLHSRLSVGERFDEWHRIRRGEVDIVVGSRSAVFAPVPRLRLIVVDEEHERTYKQTDKAPRYDARAVARRIAELVGATLVLGSATPQVESYQRALAGVDRLIELPDRVAADRLPPVEVVDLRQELRDGNRSIFSRALAEAIGATLAAGEQTILFINRRGSASIVICRACGFAPRCRRCDTPLTYHSDAEDLVCHLCNAHGPMPNVCPVCWSRSIRFLGAGTQRVEAEVRARFPTARVMRWDQDATRAKHSHEEMLDRFASGEANVLVGTQMIAKGLDLPRVTLVGVVSADIGLHLPDFRASERVFQLLTQVAGRAGRSRLPGRVIVQSYKPDHYAIVAAGRHDYRCFYEQEIAFRRRYDYPPFSRLVRLVSSQSNTKAAQREAENLHRSLTTTIGRLGLSGRVSLIGPAPAYVSRLRGRYRWQVILRGRDFEPLIGELRPGRGWTLDIDPLSLL